MLFGRERERSVIGSLLEGARASRSGVLVLRGQPGVGKSALRAALGMERRRSDERFLVSVAVLTLLAEAAEQAPLVCLIDDAHWLDEASSGALIFVARRLEAEGIVLLFAAREGDIRTFDAPGVPELYVRGLDREAATKLLGARAGVEIAPDVATRLVEGTEGNPLALFELPSILSTEQLLGNDPLPVPLPTSEGLERAFLQRVRQLPTKTQRLLLVGAADDTSRWATVLEAAKLLGIVAEDLDSAERVGLLRVQEGELEFRHPLVRSAIYQGATTSERQVAHGVLAKVLRDEPDADRRAWHLAAATVEPDDAVVRELEEAAERARDRSGFEAACAAMERAAQLTTESESRARRLAAAAENAWQAGRSRRAAGLLRGARPLTSKPLVRADIDRLRGLVELGIGSAVTAREILVDGAREVATTDPGRALQMLITAANPAALAADSGANVEIGRLAAQLNVREPRQRFVVRMLAANACFFEGDIAKAIQCLNDAVRLAEEATDAELIAEATERAALFIGDDEAAYRSRSQIVVEARAAGAIGNMIDSLFRLALVEIVTGRWTAASATASEALRLARETGQEPLLALPFICLALVSALRGEEQRLRMVAGEIEQIADVHRMAYADEAVHWAWGIFELGGGRPEAALTKLTKITHPGIRVISDLDCIEAAVFAKEERTARQWLGSLETFAAHSGTPWAQARVAHCRALMASGDVADRDFTEALAKHDQSHRPFERARTELAYGVFLRRARRRIDARAHLRTALDILEGLKATPWAERANREIAAQLFLSPRTIDFHLRNVFAKLGISRRTELSRFSLD